MTILSELDEAIGAIELEASRQTRTGFAALGLMPHRWAQVLRVLKRARAIGTPAAINGHFRAVAGDSRETPLKPWCADDAQS